MNAKLQSWLIANNQNCKIPLPVLFLFRYHARALICIYILITTQNKILKLLLHIFLRSHYHIEWYCKQTGYGLKLSHPKNIIVYAESIGNNVQINQNVTIGTNMRKTKIREWGIQEVPRIGNNVIIATNAVVGGPIIIGDHIIIGANCTCTHDIESHSLIYNKMMVSTRKIEVLTRNYSYIK